MITNRRIRILFVYSANSYGGMIKNLSLIAQHLSDECFEASFVALRGEMDSDTIIDTRQRPGMSVDWILDKGGCDFRAMNQLADRIRFGGFDIISTHGHKADVYAAVLKFRGLLRQPLVSIAHGWVVPGFKMRIYDYIDKLSLLAFSKVVLVSKSQRQELRAVPASKLSVIYNAIPLPEPADSVARQDLRKELSIDPEVMAIAFCGRLSPEKGLIVAIEAIAQLTDVPIVFVVFGEGSQRNVLEQRISELGMSDKVRLEGFVPNASRLLPAFDLYLSCSMKEGLPNNVLEAQAVGLPCVLSDIPAHSEIGIEPESATFFTAGNASEAADRIRKVINDGALRQKMSVAARRNAESHFSIDMRIEKLEELYRSLVASSSSTKTA